jgi:hypothetical protein
MALQRFFDIDKVDWGGFEPPKSGGDVTHKIYFLFKVRFANLSRQFFFKKITGCSKKTSFDSEKLSSYYFKYVNDFNSPDNHRED